MGSMIFNEFFSFLILAIGNWVTLRSNFLDNLFFFGGGGDSLNNFGGSFKGWGNF